MGRLILIGGGARSGKSRLALQLAAQRGPRRGFIATAERSDDEMSARIDRHLAERGDRFETVEAPRDPAGALAAMAAVDVVVIDCVTLWLSNLLLDGADDEAIEAAVARLADAVTAHPADVVVVTNEVGLGLVPPSELGRRFRDLTGRAHQLLAARAAEVYVGVIGLMLRLVPGPVEVVARPAAPPPVQSPHMDRDTFRESLLAVMERKEHWAWPLFTTGKVAADRLHLHFEQEYATYVRDFPVMVGWAYVQCPIADVRRDLVENVYEEETGGLVAGRPHPELFLEYPRGLGMDLGRFDDVELLPAARAYRDLLDDLTQRQGWEVAAAVTTIFIEGTRYDRGELDPNAEKRPVPPLADHPLVAHYGLPLESLALTKAHRKVEGNHREAAWRCVLDHVPADRRAAVVSAMDRCLEAWKTYRDDVAAACGLTRPAA